MPSTISYNNEKYQFQGVPKCLMFRAIHRYNRQTKQHEILPKWNTPSRNLYKDLAYWTYRARNVGFTKEQTVSLCNIWCKHNHKGFRPIRFLETIYPFILKDHKLTATRNNYYWKTVCDIESELHKFNHSTIRVSYLLSAVDQPLKTKSIAKTLSLNPYTVRKALKKLIAAGKVQKIKTKYQVVREDTENVLWNTLDSLNIEKYQELIQREGTVANPVTVIEETAMNPESFVMKCFNVNTNIIDLIEFPDYTDEIKQHHWIIVNDVVVEAGTNRSFPFKEIEKVA